MISHCALIRGVQKFKDFMTTCSGISGVHYLAWGAGRVIEINTRRICFYNCGCAKTHFQHVLFRAGSLSYMKVVREICVRLTDD